MSKEIVAAQKWHVVTRIPYFNYSKEFKSFDEAQAWVFNATGVLIAPDGQAETTYFAQFGKVIVTAPKLVSGSQIKGGN